MNRPAAGVAAASAPASWAGSRTHVGSNHSYVANGAFNGFGTNGLSVNFAKAVILNSLDIARCRPCADMRPKTLPAAAFNGDALLNASRTIVPTYTAQTLTFAAANVRRIVFTFTGGTDAYKDGRTIAWSTVSNIDYSTMAAASVVPEPSSWSPMLGGFAMLGIAQRRRDVRLRSSIA